MSGKRIVEMVVEDLRLSKILTKQNFENAIMANGALAGPPTPSSTCRRSRAGWALTRIGRLGPPRQDMPCLVNLMPSGEHLMEDFFYAGGLPTVLKEIGDFLNKDALTANGKSLWDNVKDAENYNTDVIFPLSGRSNRTEA